MRHIYIHLYTRFVLLSRTSNFIIFFDKFMQINYNAVNLHEPI